METTILVQTPTPNQVYSPVVNYAVYPFIKIARQPEGFGYVGPRENYDRCGGPLPMITTFARTTLPCTDSINIYFDNKWLWYDN